MDDFCNFVKLVYMHPGFHHSGGTVCEPVDLPVTKRHLEMIYAHQRLSDKPYMGSVTAPSRAQDTVDMSKILFGDEFVTNNTVCVSLINANSPMTWDDTMLARAQGLCTEQSGGDHRAVHSGRGNVAGLGCWHTCPDPCRSDERHRLHSGGQSWRAGDFWQFCQLDVDADGRPDLWHAGTCQGALWLRQTGPPSWGAVPFWRIAYRGQDSDAQAAYESTHTILPTVMGGVNFVLHAGGWMEGGLVADYAKLLLDADQLTMMQNLVDGIDVSENGQAMNALHETGPGQHFLGSSHTQANFETAFWRSEMADNNTFEQWSSEGCIESNARARVRVREMLDSYQEPALDPAIDEALRAFIARRMEELPDADY